MVTPLQYKHYPRSASWQVASVLNPSLHNSLPASQQSKHSREKRERESTATDGHQLTTQTEANNTNSGPEENGKPAMPPQSPYNTACKSWQEEENGRWKLTLPPQYVSPSELCKAMPKYMRIKIRPDTNNGKHVPFLTATASEPLHSHSPGLSPRYDLAVGSPRSDSGKLTPRSVLDFPQHVASSAPQQVKSSSGLASPASPARSLRNAPQLVKKTPEITPPVSAPHQNTPQVAGSRSGIPQSPRLCSAGSESPCQSAPHSNIQSPRIRSAATSPMRPAVGSPITNATPTNTFLLESKLDKIVQNPQLHKVVQIESTAQGSPLSPANSVEMLHRISTPPVALPPTPPVARQQRTRNPHPPEPTLDTYKKFSPNTHATNTVWNDRRDTSQDQTRPRRTILIKNNDGIKTS